MESSGWFEVEGPNIGGSFYQKCGLVIETKSVNGKYANYNLPAQRVSFYVNSSVEILFQLVRSSGG